MRYRVTAGEKTVLTGEEQERVERILEEVALALGTRQGSCPNYRGFGLADRVVDRPVNIAAALLRNEVMEMLEEYVPEVKVTAVTVKGDPDDPGRLIPTVEVEILAES